MTQRSESELVYKAKEGDQSAFAELFQRNQKKFSAYIRAQIRYDSSTAEDIVQDAFIIAWRKLDLLKDNERFFSWMISICRNVAYDYLREKKRTEELLECFKISDDEEEDAIEYLGDLEKMLLKLSDEEREITVLKSVLEFSFEEIAEQLSISVSAAKMRYYRSLERLKG